MRTLRPLRRMRVIFEVGAQRPVAAGGAPVDPGGAVVPEDPPPGAWAAARNE